MSKKNKRNGPVELTPTQLKMRIDAFHRKVQDATLSPIPLDTSQTVIVRAHWRRQYHHLARYPKLLNAVRRELSKIIREQTRPR